VDYKRVNRFFNPESFTEKPLCNFTVRGVTFETPKKKRKVKKKPGLMQKQQNSMYGFGQ